MAIEPSPGRLKYLDTLSRYFLCSICSKVCYHFGCISTRPSFHLVCYPLHRTSGSLFASDITRDTASSCGTSQVKTFDCPRLSGFVDKVLKIFTRSRAQSYEDRADSILVTGSKIGFSSDFCPRFKPEFLEGPLPGVTSYMQGRNGRRAKTRLLCEINPGLMLLFI
jgi:hypothetical protein